MKKLNIKLENCYGIRELAAEFDFSDLRVQAVYAPNGAMKSSLAQTFEDVSKGVPSKDRIFAERATTRKITDEHGDDIPADNVLVILPYDEYFSPSEKTSVLLVDADLRAEYEQLHVGLDRSAAALLDALKRQSVSRKNLEKEISSAFTARDDQFYKALNRVKEEVLAQTDAPFADIPYDTFFDEKVLDLLSAEDLQTSIESYVKKYNELLAASTYFRSGTFTYYNAGVIAKALANNGFFDANHSVRLNADTSLEITSMSQLEQFIADEKEGISTDADLRERFARIDKLINRNANVRSFHAYLTEHEELLPELVNMDSFREDIWKSYLRTHIELYKDLLEEYEAMHRRKEEIEQEAARQRTQWEEVIEIFNDRFFVPFELTVTNKTQVMVGEDQALRLGFTFHDGDDVATVDKSELLQVLSSGEKKALYILNIIFEIETRKKTDQETLFVVDDIADSFDYKNKYAIIQYLKEIAGQPNFTQIILTHNFDFFRTVQGRFVDYDHCWMAFKNSTKLTLNHATGIRNVFVNDWKSSFFEDPMKRIASIPFIRNIVEYTRGSGDPAYVTLTSLLHWKSDSPGISNGDLDAIYNDVFQEDGSWAGAADSVVEDIVTQANQCLTADEGINFENKIVLSIALRNASERFMIEEIADPEFVSSITSNQTAKLFDRYRELPVAEQDAITVLEGVLLMTPENIHLNSFMYEPILDMSDEHLRQLYTKVIDLS